MKEDTVARIEIDAADRLLVVPSSASFPYIWREAVEVHWDAKRSALYAPPPRKWARSRWLRQIIVAARAQGCELNITGRTEWVGVESEIKAGLLREARSSGGAR